MGSPETCEKCGRVPLRLGQTSSGPRCLSCFMRGDEQHATPTPPGAAPDAASGPKAPPRMPAPADARPMVVGGAFVKFDRPTPADDARIYPCADCGLMRSRSEGGTTFTVCDVCWDKAYPTAPAPDAGWEPWGNPYPRHPDVIRTRDLCLAICEKHQAFDAAAEIRVMHLPPAPDAGAAEDHPSEASRDHGAEGSDRAVVEALTALRDRFAALITRNPDFGATDWALVEQADAALRGTNQAKRGNDARKGGEGA